MFEYTFNFTSFKGQDEELLLATLYSFGFEEFWNERNLIRAYSKEQLVNNKLLEEELYKLPFSVSFAVRKIEEENWNALWEQSYDPVVIDNKLLIKAPFHKNTEKYKHEIVIQPKMSFGTGHHSTTQLIASYLLNFNLSNKSVIDAGCGTGILSILAEKLGATSVYAFDIDELCVENTIENCKLNTCKYIKIQKGTIQSLLLPKVDVVLANINRNVLLTEMPFYVEHLLSNGTLIISGFVQTDIELLINKAHGYSLVVKDIKNNGEWYCLVLEKNN